MHISPEALQTGVLISIFSVAFYILIRLNEILGMYSKSQLNEPRAMKAYNDIDDIRAHLIYGLSAQIQELLKREEEKRNILKEKEGESKALLESLIRSVDRLYVDKNKYYGVE